MNTHKLAQKVLLFTLLVGLLVPSTNAMGMTLTSSTSSQVDTDMADHLMYDTTYDFDMEIASIQDDDSASHEEIESFMLQNIYAYIRMQELSAYLKAYFQEELGVSTETKELEVPAAL